jgi:hypothetical protein
MSDETNNRRDEAKLALDRAHLAAAAADGGKLRRALTDAADALDAIPTPSDDLSMAAAKVRAALKDLDKGALLELETLLEEARRSVAE